MRSTVAIALTSAAFLISSLPQTIHGVVPHSWIKYLPTRSRLNMV
jgi:hypothetical protein